MFDVFISTNLILMATPRLYL